MNKFDQVSSVGHQMLVAGGGEVPGLMPKAGGGGPTM